MNILELTNVTKRFGTFAAVDNISFTVQKGKIVSLLGPSGCGKTTTLRLISGFEDVDKGSILFSGKDVKNKRPYERNVGLLFQDYALFPHMTVEQNVAYGLKRDGISKKEIIVYARENGIPYLKNTTPTWSSRGRLRNEFLPAMDKQFGDSMRESLLHMSETAMLMKVGNSGLPCFPKCVARKNIGERFGLCCLAANIQAVAALSRR